MVLFWLTWAIFITPERVRSATIVLDPGHGGPRDVGVSFEKRFTLKLAQRIAARLNTRHRVELTRNSDIALLPADRAAVANHLRADLMISLHVAVAPYCHPKTAAIYYHDEQRLSLPSTPDLPSDLEGDQPSWDRLQTRHQHQSQYLAALLKQTLINGNGSFDGVSVYGVPLVPLMGADQPAVLVEVGCVHPTVSADPNNTERRLDDYAAALARAIEMAAGQIAP